MLPFFSNHRLSRNMTQNLWTIYHLYNVVTNMCSCMFVLHLVVFSSNHLPKSLHFLQFYVFVCSGKFILKWILIVNVTLHSVVPSWQSTYFHSCVWSMFYVSYPHQPLCVMHNDITLWKNVECNVYMKHVKQMKNIVCVFFR